MLGCGSRVNTQLFKVFLMNKGILFLFIGFVGGYLCSQYNIFPSGFNKSDHQKSVGHYKDDNCNLYTVELLDNDPKMIDNLNGIIESVQRLAIRLAHDDPEAIQIMFNLLSISDGAASEAIHIQLGQIIKRNPTLFLELLNKNYSASMHLDGVVGNLGSDYVDEPDKSAIEIKQRIDAIHSVEDPNLEEIKEKVLRSLRS